MEPVKLENGIVYLFKPEFLIFRLRGKTAVLFDNCFVFLFFSFLMQQYFRLLLSFCVIILRQCLCTGTFKEAGGNFFVEVTFEAFLTISRMLTVLGVVLFVHQCAHHRWNLSLMIFALFFVCLFLTI